MAGLTYRATIACRVDSAACSPVQNWALVLLQNSVCDGHDHPFAWQNFDPSFRLPGSQTCIDNQTFHMMDGPTIRTGFGTALSAAILQWRWPVSSAIGPNCLGLKRKEPFIVCTAVTFGGTLLDQVPALACFSKSVAVSGWLVAVHVSSPARHFVQLPLHVRCSHRNRTPPTHASAWHRQKAPN